MNFVALDVETANHNRDSICSIGMIKVKDNQIIDSYYTLINPKQQFNWHFTQIHGINYDDVINEPIFEDVAYEIIDFWNDVDFIVAHNAPFDMSVLVKSFERYNIEFDHFPYVCSLAISKGLYQLEQYKLNVMADYFGLELNHHNALSDAMVCAQLLIEICKDHDSDVETLMSLLHYDYGLLGLKGFKLNMPKNKRNKISKKGLRKTKEEIVLEMKDYSKQIMKSQVMLNQLNQQMNTVQKRDRIKLQTSILTEKKKIEESRLKLEKLQRQLKM